MKHRLGDESLPWQAIARECNFGHNSGSCQQRYAQLPELQWADKNKIYFPAMGGEPIATKMNNMRK